MPPKPARVRPPDPSGFPLPDGGRIYWKPPPERLKIDEYLSPAPGQYGVPSDPSRPRNVCGRFGRDLKITKFIHDEQMRSRHIPGPGAHDPQEAAENLKPFCPEGGRYLDAHKPPGYFDVAPKLWEANPPPGSYETPGAINIKTVGRTVYRYESATIQETKDLITRVVGKDDAPGPGSYSLPEPPLIAGPPSFKGRTTPTFPHPFASSCAPDYTKSLSSLAPVRQQNNAEQIFGTGWRQGAAAIAKQGRGLRKIESENAQLSELPIGVGEEEKPSDENSVQWRPGGFSKLKKSKSESNVKAVEEHPSVEEAMKFYPSLARKHNRADAIFLPMSSRRTEKLSTHNAAEENLRLGRSKWKLAAVVESIENATSAALEPLDVEKLRQYAMKGLRDKAINRMKLQGVSFEQQQVILEEMESLILERSQRSQNSSVSLAPGIDEIVRG